MAIHWDNKGKRKGEREKEPNLGTKIRRPASSAVLLKIPTKWRSIYNHNPSFDNRKEKKEEQIKHKVSSRIEIKLQQKSMKLKRGSQ